MKPGRPYFAIGLWLALTLACIGIISRAHFTTDLSAFLPRTPTAQQRLLVDQIRDGLASRLILVGLAGGNSDDRARLSKEMARQLRADPQFVGIHNGEPVYAERDRAYLFGHRYALGDRVTPQRFSVAGLHDALGQSIDLLSSPAGPLIKTLFVRDPTGETMRIVDQINRRNPPRLIGGAWASTDGERALLLLQTRASGSDTDAQQRAVAAIRQAYAEAGGTDAAHDLLMTGPGVFSVSARHTIKTEVTRLSLLSSALIAGLLLWVYRSPVALLLGFLPVISGALAGIAAVSLGFGVVHGITLGFGTALIGEAVDYSVYFLVQPEPGAPRKDWMQQFWPTVRLGLLTSVAGFASLLLSSFPGLAQLGLYAIAGLVAAAGVTRFVLPHLLPPDLRTRDIAPLGAFLAKLTPRRRALRWGIMAITVIACLQLYSHRTELWNHNLSALSPIPARDLALDARLRADLGAPDVRYLIVVPAASQEAALVGAERVSAQLQPLVAQSELAGFDSPSRYLPSNATQRARLDSLPDAATLARRLTSAVAGLPVHAQRFAPFLADVATARDAPPIQRADLDHTSFALAVDGLLLYRGTRWSALLPLTAPATGLMPGAAIAAALARSGEPDAVFVDLKAESDRLYADYLNEAITLSAGGLFIIICLLLLALRSLRRVLRVAAPLAAAVLTVMAGLSRSGQPLIILHLVGLLLVVAIGSNYALFFERDATRGDMTPRTLASLFIASLTTVAGFGLLALSSVPILQAMGTTVAPGVILALFYSAMLRDDQRDQH